MFVNFSRESFYPLRKKLNVLDIEKIIYKQIINSKIDNHSIFISNISSNNIFFENSIIFIDKKIKQIPNSKNLCVLITDNLDIFEKSKIPSKFLIQNLNECYYQLTNQLFIHDDNIDYTDEFKIINNSYISKYATIDSSTKIFNNCVIGRGVNIGKNCIIKNGVIIKNAILGDNIIISDNTTIGSNGFGFDLKKLGAKSLLPQLGIVHIDDNVHIGSNCTLDRAKVDITYIGKNSMIDNLVHIAHNVVLGKNSCIAAQTGISGSVTFDDNVIVGGQAGFAGHISVGKNVIVAAKSGVTKNIKDNSVIAGFPAIDIKEWKKIIINQKKNGHK